LRRGLTDATALVTARPQFHQLDLDLPGQFVLGGHDIRRGDFATSVRALARGSSIFDPTVVEACTPDLEAWSADVRPGTVMNSGDTIAALADRPDLPRRNTPREIVSVLQADLAQFRTRHRLDQVVVVNVASTEPPFAHSEDHESLDRLVSQLDDPAILPVSSLYAYAA